MKLQPAVKKELAHITYGVCGLGTVMLLVFAVIGKFQLSVLIGFLIGALVAVINFLMLGLTVQKVAESASAQGAYMIRLSYSVRLALLGIYIFWVLRMPLINSLTAIITLFFPRVTIAVMNFAGYMKERKHTL